ncbi:MAG: VOC family protein [Conexibacter sp.]
MCRRLAREFENALAVGDQRRQGGRGWCGRHITRSRSVRWEMFHAPSGRGGDRHAPANTPGIRHVAFAVDDIDAVVASLRARGAELVGEVERYEDRYRLCYVRGPEGIIVGLAEQIG